MRASPHLAPPGAPGWLHPLLLVLLALVGVSAWAGVFTSPLASSELDASAYSQCVAGTTTAMSGAPSDVLWTTTTGAAGIPVVFGNTKTTGARHLRVGLTTAKSVGTLIVKGNVTVSVLKSTATYPGSLTNEADWTPADRLLDGAVVTSQAGSDTNVQRGADEVTVWVLPSGTSTRAIRLTHTAQASDYAYEGSVSGVHLLSGRYANVAPQATAVASAHNENTLYYHDGSDRVNNGYDESHTATSWDHWGIFKGWHNGTNANPISETNREWVMLSWPAATSVRGLNCISAGFSSARVEYLPTSVTAHPRAAKDSDWVPIAVNTNVQPYAATTGANQLGPNWFDFGATIATKAVRLQLCAPANTSGTSLDTVGGKKVWLAEVQALQDLGSSALSSAVVTASRTNAAIPISFTLSQAGYVTLAINDSTGKRVRNLIADTYFPAGTNTVYWDGLDESQKADEALGFYHPFGHLVPTGTYTVTGLTRNALTLTYEMPVNSGARTSTPTSPPWFTRDMTGGWLNDHGSAQGAVFIPGGNGRILLGGNSVEWGDALAVTNLSGQKLYGVRSLGSGGLWSGATMPAVDVGTSKESNVDAYYLSFGNGANGCEFWSFSQPNVAPYLTYNAPGPNAGRWSFNYGVTLDATKPNFGGLAVRNQLAVIGLTQSNQLAMVNAATGSEYVKNTVSEPRGVAFDSNGKLLVVTGSSIKRYAVNADKSLTEEATLVTGVTDAYGFCVDLDTNDMYVSQWGTLNTVKVYSSAGTLVRTIGTAGAAATRGAFVATHLNQPWGLTISKDSSNNKRLWVVDSYSPKRVTVWTLTGTLADSFSGPGSFGQGAVLDPQNKNRAYVQGWYDSFPMEFALDWTTRTHSLTSLYGENYRTDYFAGFGGGSYPIYANGQQYMTNSWIAYNYRSGVGCASITQFRNGLVVPVASVGNAHEWALLKTAPFDTRWTAYSLDKANTGQAVLYAWTDTDNDQVVDPSEVSLKALSTGVGAVVVQYDLTIDTHTGWALSPSGYTAAGAPIFDAASATRALTLNPGVHGGYDLLKGANGWKVFFGHPYEGYQNGTLKWTYPNSYAGLCEGVPIEEPQYPGHIISTIRPLGHPVTPSSGQAGEVMAVASLRGQVHLLTTDGLYLGALGKDERDAPYWVAHHDLGLRALTATPGMDLSDSTFGYPNTFASWTKANDGNIYVVAAGETNTILRLDGLNSVTRFTPWTVTVNATNQGSNGTFPATQEQERQQYGVGKQTLVIKRATLTADGTELDWPDDTNWLTLRNPYPGWGQNFTQRIGLAVSGTHLVCYGDLPGVDLRNDLPVWQELFRTGGCIVLNLGTNGSADATRTSPVAGDLKLVVSKLANETPKAVLYRQVASSGTPYTFTNGSRAVTLQDVQDVSAALTMNGTEFSIPLSVLGWDPQPGVPYLGDIGVIWSKGDGSSGNPRTAYWGYSWNGRQTSTVINDEVSEAQLYPGTWGQFVVEANVAPTATLTSPGAGSLFVNTTSIPLRATAGDPDGTVSKVEFYAAVMTDPSLAPSITKLGEDTTAPYAFTWSNPSNGYYLVMACAVDQQGGRSAFSQAYVTVGTVSQGTGSTPTCSLTTTPASGSTVTVPGSTVSMTATASNGDGVSYVHFYAGREYLGVDNTSPYSYTWTPTAGTSYSLTARAFGPNGKYTDSAASTVTVKVKPVVAITTPVTGAQVPPSPNTIQIDAVAGDDDGTVSQVQFFNGATSLGVDTTAPYRYTWTNVTPGTYTLTAVATDSHSTTTTSSAVTVTMFAASQAEFISFDTTTQGTWFSGSTYTYGQHGWMLPGWYFGGDQQDLKSGSGGFVSGFKFNNWPRWAPGTSTTDPKAIANPNGGWRSYAGAYTWSWGPNGIKVYLNDPGDTSWHRMALCFTDFFGEGRGCRLEVCDPYTGQSILPEGSIVLGDMTMSKWAIFNFKGNIAIRAIDGYFPVLSAICFDNLVNRKPEVSLTSPANNATYTVGQNVTLTATASDDGSVSKVEFFQGGAKIAEDTSSPYSCTWSNLQEGYYDLTAKATDNTGLSTTSSTVTISVPITSVPTNGLVLWTQGDRIGAAENAAVTGWGDLSGNHNNASQDTTANQPTYKTNLWKTHNTVQFDGTNDALSMANSSSMQLSGDMTFMAVASFDNWNNGLQDTLLLKGYLGIGLNYAFAKTNTGALRFMYCSSTGTWWAADDTSGFRGANDAPDVLTWVVDKTAHTVTLYVNGVQKSVITDPNNLDYLATSTIGATIGARNSDGGDGLHGKISEILLYNRKLNVGERAMLENALKAKYVNLRPTITLTAPLNGRYFAQANTITLSADAADEDGTVSKVEFYDGTTLLNTDSSSPYSYAWTNAALGAHTVSAKVYDNEDAVVTSSTVHIHVANSTMPTDSMKLWLKASTLTLNDSDPVASWADSSGTNNTATQSTTSLKPIYVANGVNNMPVVRFDGANDKLGFTAISDARTVIWLLKEDADVTPNARPLFGHDTLYDFHRGGGAPGNMWGGSSYITGGLTRVNGTQVDGSATPPPSTLGIVTLRTTGNVNLSNFAEDRGMTGRNWDGDLAEVLVYNRALTDQELIDVEYYLYNKYHFENQTPAVSLTSPTDGTRITPGSNVTLNATATDPDGTVSKVEFYQGSTLLGTDSTSPYSYTWTSVPQGGYFLAAKAYDNLSSPTTSSTVELTVNNGSMPTDSMAIWLKADAITGLNNNDPVGSWVDSSGASNTATETTATRKPLYITNAVNGKPVVRFDGTDDAVYFSAISTARTLFWVVKEDEDATDHYRHLAGHSSLYDFHRGGFKTMWGGSTNVTQGLTWLNGTPVNGSSTTAPTSMALVSLRTLGDTNLSNFVDDRGMTDRTWDGDLAELVVYTRSLTKLEIQQVEDSLNAKYALFNRAPVVSLTSPTDGASTTPGSTVSLEATASDSDGTISTVEFYKDGALLGTDSTSPYSYSWTNVPSGVFTLTAKATDNGNTATISAPVVISSNATPTVSLTAPSNNATYTAPANITITATAADSDGAVSKVEFYDGTTKLGEDISSPFSYTWSSVFQGSYSLTAKAYDNMNAVTTSSAVNVTVSGGMPTDSMLIWLKSDAITGLSNGDPVTTWVDSSSAGNNAAQNTTSYKPTFITNALYGKPVVRFDGSDDVLNFSTISTARTIFWVMKEDADATFNYRCMLGHGTEYPFHRGNVKYMYDGNTSSYVRSGVTRVNGSAVNGELTNPPTDYSIISLRTTGNVAVSNFAEDRGMKGRSWDGDIAELMIYSRALTDQEIASVEDYLNTRYRVINAAPTVSITAPSNNASYQGPTDITITANASDSDGSISKVEFYNGANLLGTDSTSPYSYTWSDVWQGSYSLTAKAYDNYDKTTTSSAVNVSVSGGLSGSGIQLWLKADAITGLNTGDPVATWNDNSGNGNNATQSTSSYKPTYITNALNGKPVVRFDGSDDVLNFPAISTTRTVFWVMKEDADATFNYRCMLGHGTEYPFHRGNVKYMYDGNTSSYVRSGVTRVNGTAVNGETTNPPTSFGFITLRTTDNVTVSSFAQDRGMAGRVWDGDIAELIIYNRALSDQEILDAESYLNAKYRINNNVPTVSITSPTNGSSFTPGGNVTMNATASDTDGTISKVEFYQGTTKLGEDSTSPYSYTWSNVAAGTYVLTAKATDNENGVTTSSGVSISDLSIPTDSMIIWLKADAITGLSNNDPVGTWADSSGGSNNATQSTASYKPLYITNILNGKPVVRFDGANDVLNFTRATNIRTVFWVMKEDANATDNLRPILGDSSDYHFHRGGSKYMHGGYTSSYIRNGVTRVNGSAVNGETTVAPTSYSILTVRATGNVSASCFAEDRGMQGRDWDGDVAEMIIYSRALSDTEIEDVEDYLADKYGL